MRAKDLMVKPSPSVYCQSSLEQISQALVQHDTGAVLILADDDSLLGIVTDGDLFRRRRRATHSFLEHCLARDNTDGLADPCSTRSVCAEDVMSHPVISVSEEAEIVTIAGLLMQHGIRRIPVVRNGHVVGMLGRRDVLRALLYRPCPSPAVS